MRVDEAKAMVLALISTDLSLSRLAVSFETMSPDSKDPEKFLLNNKPAGDSSLERLASGNQPRVVRR